MINHSLKFYIYYKNRLYVGNKTLIALLFYTKPLQMCNSLVFIVKIYKNIVVCIAWYIGNTYICSENIE